VFTGIVETTAEVESLAPATEGTRRLAVKAPPSFALASVPMGGSIAVDGVCLTLVARRGRRFEADLGPETLALTTLGSLAAGDRIHLERPLRMGDPLGGHLVAGHADGIGRVTRARRHGDALELSIAAPPALAPYLAVKGSVAVDGVSLTVNRVDGATFSVTLIPHTLTVTKLGTLTAGDGVNIEADLLAKHVARILAVTQSTAPRARARTTNEKRMRRSAP
jgi:riboflavin synthase